jgi:hypothetical protein
MVMAQLARVVMRNPAAGRPLMCAESVEEMQSWRAIAAMSPRVISHLHVAVLLVLILRGATRVGFVEGRTIALTAKAYLLVGRAEMLVASVAEMAHGARAAMEFQIVASKRISAENAEGTTRAVRIALELSTEIKSSMSAESVEAARRKMIATWDVMV